MHGFSGYPTPRASADPVRGNLKSAPDPFRRKDEINLTTELEPNKLENYACPMIRGWPALRDREGWQADGSCPP